MTVKSEGLHAGEGLVSEANGYRSRDVVTITGAALVLACTVLGKIQLGAETSAAGTNTGNGVLGTVTVAADAQVGAYKLKITKAAANAGDFELIDPQGDVVGIGTVGVAFSGGGLSFTLADGATDFVVGDSFTLTVAKGSGKYVPVNAAATDGSQHAAGILWADADASAADVQATAIVRDAEWNAQVLIWPVGATDNQKAAWIADLAANHLIVR